MRPYDEAAPNTGDRGEFPNSPMRGAKLQARISEKPSPPTTAGYGAGTLSVVPSRDIHAGRDSRHWAPLTRNRLDWAHPLAFVDEPELRALGEPCGDAVSLRVQTIARSSRGGPFPRVVKPRRGQSKPASRHMRHRLAGVALAGLDRAAFQDPANGRTHCCAGLAGARHGGGRETALHESARESDLARSY